jgi:hypothetical protein
MNRRLSLACLVTVGAALLSVPAFADDDEAAKADARRIAEQGDEAFAAGRCDQAIPLWTEALQRYHAPTILVRIARCQALLGKVVDAESTLVAMLDEPLPPNAPPIFAEVRRSAQSDLESVRARIAKLVVAIDDSGLSGERRIEVDGHAVDMLTGSVDPNDYRFRIDPGKHRLRVGLGPASWEETLLLGDGESRTVHVSFREQPGTVVRSSQRLVGFVLGGAGMLTMAVGAALGVAAVNGSHNLLGPCGQDRQHCPPSEQGAIDTVRSEALASDLTLGGGAALFLAGALVVLTAPPPHREAPRVEVVPWGAGMRVQGSF